MIYATLRALFSLALRLFFRVEATVDPHGGLRLSGPVIFVGNHPNGLIDPAVLLMAVDRQVTFLAKEPLFRMPLIGALLRAMGALPVYRKQDGPGDTSKNDGTLTAAVEALVRGGAITLFPEGKSHSEPQLAALKTGAARIALEAVRKGAPVQIVPVGMTYSAKHQFQSRVHLEVGAPLLASDFLEAPQGDAHDAARRLTEAMAEALHGLTLNLYSWEELPLLQTAEALYALVRDDESPVGNTARLKAFARGAALLREEQPKRFERLKSELGALGRRLQLLNVGPSSVTSYRAGQVIRFVLRNLLWLLAAPVAVAGWVLFVIPYQLPRLAVKVMRPEVDVESTVKFLAAVVFAPAWWALLVVLSAWRFGLGFGAMTLVAVPPLAVFTHYFWQERLNALRDAKTFLTLMSQRRMRRALELEARRLSGEIAALVQDLGSRH